MASFLREMGLYGPDGDVVRMGIRISPGGNIFRFTEWKLVSSFVVEYFGLHVVGNFGFVEPGSFGGEIQ
jgi:hypothetical protein